MSQIHVDTLRHEKEGEFMAWKVGKAIAHNSPTWKLKFNIEPGLNLIYRKDGSLYQEGSYLRKDDSLIVRSGQFEYFYENGQLRDSGVYKNDKRIGVWTHFDENGVLIYEQDFNTMTRTYFSLNKDTLAFGKMKFQNENSAYEFFDLTDHEGYWEFRNANGSCECKGNLVSNLKHGKWLYYSYDNNELTTTKKRYSKYIANYNYDFLDLCKWN